MADAPLTPLQAAFLDVVRPLPAGRTRTPAAGQARQECTWMPLSDPPGADLRPDLGKITTAADFTEAMRLYHIWAGNPSFRDMASRCRHRLSASTFQALLKQETLPKLGTLREFLWACGTADDYRDRFVAAWERVRGNGG